jgi:hypothetical protein
LPLRHRNAPEHGTHSGPPDSAPSDASWHRVLDYPTAQSILVAALLCLIALPRQVVFDPTTTSSYRQVDAAGASRVLPPAGLAMDSRNRVDIGSRAPPYECTSSVVGGTVVHQPAIAVGNPGNAVLPASDRSLAERYRSRFFAMMGCFQKTAAQRARIPAWRTVLPSYSRYAINYSIEHFAGYYGLYFGQSSVGQCKHR